MKVVFCHYLGWIAIIRVLPTAILFFTKVRQLGRQERLRHHLW